MTTWLERFGEACNPVFVKDVRAALRGRAFKFVLIFEIAIALVVGFLVLNLSQAVQNDVSGVAYFGTVFGCLALGAHLIVPFGAMQSLSSEHDEHTLEFLQLSGLAAWRLVLGKFLCALLQALLIYSVFLPFLSFAFLLRGVAFETILQSLGVSAAICTAQTAAGLVCGALAQTRAVRIVLSVLLLIGLMYTGPIAFAVLAGTTFGGPGAGPGIGAIVIVALTAAIGCTTFAAVLLAHAEENRSTPVRVATTFVTLVGCGFAAFSGSLESATIELAITLLCIAPALFFIVTERDTLPRAVAAHPPGWALRFPPLIAWLPGGGRGVLYALLHLGFLVVFQVGLQRFVHGGRVVFDGLFMRLLATALVACAFIVLPSALGSRFASRPHGVAMARFVIAMVVVGVVVVPVLAGEIARVPGLAQWSLVSSPLSFDAAGSTRDPGPWVLVLVLAGLAVVLNVTRMSAGIREVRALRGRRGAEVRIAASQP